MFQIEKSLILLTSSFNTTKVFLLITVALADFKNIFVDYSHSIVYKKEMENDIVLCYILQHPLAFFP